MSLGVDSATSDTTVAIHPVRILLSASFPLRRSVGYGIGAEQQWRGSLRLWLDALGGG